MGYVRLRLQNTLTVSGIPSPVIRFSTAHLMAASTCWFLIENLQIELLNLQLLKAYCFAASRMRSAIVAIVVAAS